VGSLKLISGSLKLKLTWQFAHVAFGHVELATWQHGLFTTGQCGLGKLAKWTWQVGKVELEGHKMNLAGWQSGIGSA
jgi:hypothetical protein